jgi:hypothetical protein
MPAAGFLKITTLFKTAPYKLQAVNPDVIFNCSRVMVTTIFFSDQSVLTGESHLMASDYKFFFHPLFIKD